MRAVHAALRAATVVVTLLPAASASAQESVSEPTLMVVELPRGARFIGFPRRCPGDTEEEPEGSEESLCLAELYEGWATRVRHVSGPRLAYRSRLRLTAHAKSWPPGTRLLVAVLPFQDQGVSGRFAYWWDPPAAGDDYCQAIGDLRSWPDNAIRQAFTRGYHKRFRPHGYLEATDFRCIRG